MLLGKMKLLFKSTGGALEIISEREKLLDFEASPSLDTTFDKFEFDTDFCSSMLLELVIILYPIMMSFKFSDLSLLVFLDPIR